MNNQIDTLLSWRWLNSEQGYSHWNACCCWLSRFLPQGQPIELLLGQFECFDSHWHWRAWRLPATYSDPGQPTMATHTRIVMLWPLFAPPPPSLLHWWIAFLTRHAWRVLRPHRTPDDHWELHCFPSLWLQTSRQSATSLTSCLLFLTFNHIEYPVLFLPQQMRRVCGV